MLGCPKNLVGSERILTQLRTEGYDVTNSYNDAELVIVNTCGFIDSAVQESLILAVFFYLIHAANMYRSYFGKIHFKYKLTSMR